MAAGGHFRCPKITFDLISGHFRSIHNFNYFFIFDKMAAVGHFGCPKLTLDHISGHFRSTQIFLFFIFFYKMAAGGHFGCPKIPFDLICIHFTSIRNFNFFLKFLTKWLASGILDIRISLSIAFLAISDQYSTLFFFNFWQNGWPWPFWMSEIHFWSQFWPFQIDTEFFIFFPAAILDVWKSLWIAFLAISDWSAILDVRNSLSMEILAIQIHTELKFFIFDKTFFDFFWQNGRRRPFWMGRQCQLSNSSEIFGWVMHVSSLKNVV